MNNDMVRDLITEAFTHDDMDLDVFKDNQNGWSWYSGSTLLLREGTPVHKNVVDVCNSDDYNENWLYDTIKGIILADLCKRYSKLADSVSILEDNIEIALGKVYELLWHDCAD